ncbi:hypothetical protein L6452_02938 [Arctium lappa]|uniref:Uncharacterized protein n=1 Tax=Arctium lappa TaxID=4217 RepID=A0ACB9FLN3_ARCLA|nr:hypothetical protein L6452_02938 [Arctium lappa]
MMCLIFLSYQMKSCNLFLFLACNRFIQTACDQRLISFNKMPYMHVGSLFINRYLSILFYFGFSNRLHNEGSFGDIWN